MGPMPHIITPDLSEMAHIGPKPDHATLGTYAMRSSCETCRNPILCRRWPLEPWRHATPEELAELAGEGAQ